MNFFLKLHFRNKLLLTFLLVLIPLVLTASMIAYHQAQKILQTNIENELQATSRAFVNLIRTSARISVKNRLRAIAEKNLEIARYYYKKYESGAIDKDQAVRTIEEILLSQTIGKSGYIYCLNSKGIITLHPKPGVLHTRLSQFGFIQKQLEMKKGYLEYDWKNPGEEEERPKALYMVYFKPLDWIISVSSYREEFSYLVDFNDLKESILAHKIGKSGYGYILDDKGLLLIHPTIAGVNMLDQNQYPNDFIKKMVRQKNGQIRYSWKNPGEHTARDKIVLFRYLPEFKWIVACSNYKDDVFSPLKSLRLFLFGVLSLFLALLIAAAFLISRSVTRPLDILVEKLEQGAKGNLSVRMTDHGQDEFGMLARHFNSFMAQLESSHNVIEEQSRRNMEARNALVENDLKLRSLFNQSFQYTGILSPTGVLEEINQSGLDFAGCSLEKVAYIPFWQMPWWRHDIQVQKQIKEKVKLAEKGELVRFETTSISSEEHVRHIDLSIKPVFNSSGDVAFIITEGRDITEYKLAEKERKNLAVQMEKAQKMESIGTLAGGIAHDFNNILSGILGYAQLAELNLDQPVKAKGHITMILKGARRAARLTQQILTFSRKQEYEKSAIELQLIVKEALKLLRSSIPVTIAIEENVRSDKLILADPTQMHQVIMNLCTNAYHAMGQTGGVLTVNLKEKRTHQEIDFFDQVIKNGDYLVLEISDTGVGMDRRVMAKVFDPYFTTKDVGKGTGFGLALVHAIVDEHDGYIKLKSSPGKGSRFFIYLPIIESSDENPLDMPGVTQIEGGTEKIMVVDDEIDIQIIVRQFLESNGYSVEVFKDGTEAIAAFKQNPDKYDLILTDMTMPNMTGDELSRQVLQIRKKMPIVICTGYSETFTEADALEIGIRRYIQKPLTHEELCAVVRDVLDQG